MATYVRYSDTGGGFLPFMFSNSVLLGTISSTSLTTVGFDGTLLVYAGTGFVFTGGAALAGTITSIRRTTADGLTTIEEISGLTAGNNSLVDYWNQIANFERMRYLLSQDDMMTGSSGNDQIWGAAGANVVNMGDGIDSYNLSISPTDTGIDIVDGGAGTFDNFNISTTATGVWVDLAYAGYEVWTKEAGVWRALADVSNFENVVGTVYDDQLYGNGVDNFLVGGNGNDVIYGRSGTDTLDGGGGADSLYGDAGADILGGGAGNDNLFGGADNDAFFVQPDAASGLDFIDGGTGTGDVLNCQNFSSIAWVDLAAAGAEAFTKTSAGAWQALANLVNVENVSGTLYNDEMWGNAANNELLGLGGNDKLDGRAGVDTIDGGNGDDIITGGDGADSLNGSFGDDRFVFASNLTGLDTVSGGDGNDTVDCSAFTTKAWVDLAYNGAEVFTINAGVWKAIANVGSVESIIGSGVADELFGDALDNTIVGGGGNDLIVGRKAVDTATGGAGSDTFKFALGDSGLLGLFDKITDFAKGAVGTGDKIDFAPSLTVGGSTTAATSTQASINATTGVATFAAGSGTTLNDALTDIASSFIAGGDAAGDFALFRINNTGPVYMLVSDGLGGYTNDVLVQLSNVTSVGSINLAGGDLTVLT